MMARLITETKEGWLLANGQIAYALRAAEDGVVEHLHFGAPIGPLQHFSAWPRQAYRSLQIDAGGADLRHLGTLPQELPFAGRGDFRRPAISFEMDGRIDLDLQYREARIDEGKPSLGVLPTARGDDGAETLTIIWDEKRSGVEVALHLSIWPDHPIIARSLTLTNKGAAPLRLETLKSLSLDLPSADRDVLHLTGSWAREMAVQRHIVREGVFSFGSRRGTSSAQHAPFAALVDPYTMEKAGEVTAATILYSGDHEFSIEQGEFGDHRLQAGLPPRLGWILPPGEVFHSPEALLLWTNEGLEGMSHAWHDFVQKKISPPRADQHRPVYLNTWESCYFDVDQDKVEALAAKAKSLGCEMLVLDDGWFKGRSDDTTSLGDWTADPERFSRGIDELASRVTKQGLAFGLWFEPEMVSPGSDLLKAHPDWVLGHRSSTPGLGRNQRILNLGLPEVIDHLDDVLSGHLQSGHITYVKWDMNRVMSDLPTPDSAHRYMLGLYQLIGRLTEKFPGVVFENCASGGNRFDFGMLRFFHQTWTSDLCDPIGRLIIQSGASLFFPLSVLASYIGPSPNHQNGRITSFQARRDVAFFCGSRGFSLSDDDLEVHRKEMEEAIDLFRSTQDDVIGGCFYRLQYAGNETIWQLNNREGTRISILYARVLSEANPSFARAYLRHLDPDAHYRLQGAEAVYSGASLMAAGLPMPHHDPRANLQGMAPLPLGDHGTALLILEKCPQPE